MVTFNQLYLFIGLDDRELFPLLLDSILLYPTNSHIMIKSSLVWGPIMLGECPWVVCI
jgi:hypothetical protein